MRDRFTLIFFVAPWVVTIILYACFRYQTIYSELPDKNHDSTNHMDFIMQRTGTKSVEHTTLNKTGRKPQPDSFNKISETGVHGRTVIAVLVIACNRVSIARCLDSLLKYRPSSVQFPIIVSQGCLHKATSEVIQSKNNQINHISPTNVNIFNDGLNGYQRIAKHYVWALNQTFFNYNFSYAIIVEDDLEISIDFFEYFLGTLPILQADPSLLCVSAWNDNSKLELIQRDAPDILYRTDFFPGLGWMLTKDTWTELAPKWPPTFWDDWVRQPLQRRGRACIRPEISRTKTFGKHGVSNGQFYEDKLKHMYLNQQFVPFTKLNLTYLLRDNYDSNFTMSIYNSEVISYEELKNYNKNSRSVRVLYNSIHEFQKILKTLGLMSDFKSGVPRTGYHGIVSVYYKNRRVYLTPKYIFKK